MSRLATVIGRCQTDVVDIANAVNTAQRRLIFAREAGDEGWYGSFAEVTFNVSRSTPYITLPREIARIEALDACKHPVPVRNQFFEFMQFGNGRLPKCRPNCGQTQVLSRNNACTFVTLTNAPQGIRIFLTDAADVGKRVLVQGTDTSGNTIISQDVLNQVQGQFVALEQPFASLPFNVNTLTGLQKDVTSGPVQVYQVDPVTGEQILLVTMEPGETTAWYRRYYFDQLPAGYCATPGNPGSVQINAIVKLDLIPVAVDTDFCLIQNLEAIINECQSARYSEIDTVQAKQMATEAHLQAIRMLNGELTHYYGSKSPSVDYAPMGHDNLAWKRVGSIL